MPLLELAVPGDIEGFFPDSNWTEQIRDQKRAKELGIIIEPQEMKPNHEYHKDDRGLISVIPIV